MTLSLLSGFRSVFASLRSEALIKTNNVDYYAHRDLTEGFSDKDLVELYALGTEEVYQPSQKIFDESDDAHVFYIILDGKATVYMSKSSQQDEKSTDYNIATLVKGDVIGEMALVKDALRSATVKAESKLTVLSFKIAEIREKPHLLAQLTQNIAIKLADRLRHTNKVTVSNMESCLIEAQSRNILGIFIIALFWLSCFYTLSLRGLIALQHYVVSPTLISVGLMMIYAIGIIATMRMTGLPLVRFGISLKDWSSQSVEALFYTLPFMVLAVLIKLGFIYFSFNPKYPCIFSGYSVTQLDGEPSYKLYALLIFLYCLFVPLQELMARSAMQTTFFLFIPGDETFRKWNAIILANLIFATAHVHLGFMFAVLTFIPGLFWGCLFQKQNSLIGVSVSHAVLGVWILFIVGFKGYIY